MRIGLDFDGTIASWAGAMDRWLREAMGRPLDPDRHIVEQVTREQLQAMVGAILGTALTLEMTPEEGALDAMTRLARDHELLVITARHDHEAAFAAQWLERHGAPVGAVVSTGRALKADTCRELAIGVLLDDTADHLLALDATATVPVLFRTRFGNRAAQPPFIHVVEHWQAFEALCSRLVADDTR
ncbi:MAG: hypothetical protein WEB13_11940 [Dehalococcoidia bacterium]